MAEHRLTVEIKGPAETDGDLRLQDFVQFLWDLRRLLDKTDRAVTHGDEATTFYRVGKLQRNSPAVVVLHAEPRDVAIDLRTRVLGKFVTSISEIQAGRRPQGLHTDLLLDFQDVARKLQGFGSEASFRYGKRRARVAPGFSEKIEQLIGPEYREHGSISGAVDAVNAHQRAYFWLYPLGPQERIKCYFSSDLMDDVRRSIRRYVTVSGMLKYRANTLQPYEILADEIDIHEPEADLPSIRSLRGIAPDATGHESADQFIRRLRDGW